MARERVTRLRALQAELARLRLEIGAHREELAALHADRASAARASMDAVRAQGDRLAEEFRCLRAELDGATGCPPGSP